LNIETVLIGFSSAVFLFYGVLCLTSLSMVKDFQRFGIANVRTLTGVLEVSGGIDLLVGYKRLLALRTSSGGLALLMLIAFVIRVRFRDSFAELLPSLLLMLLNAYILVYSLET
jgi:uncharacterized membrane protein YphA (DoxX/SURF4 family)